MLVMHVGRRGDDGMGQLGHAIHPALGLDTEVPLIALPGLVHLGAAPAVAVLDQGRSIDDFASTASRTTPLPPPAQKG